MLIFAFALMLCGPLATAKKKPPASTTVTVNLPAASRLKQVQGDQRILHALDRLTFGPRPGELEEVKAMGLDAWITQQLHPSIIDDSALDQRLEQFPAMRLSEQDLTRKFPPGSVIRQVENGKMSVPLFNATERAIYENQLVAERKKQEQDKAKAPIRPRLLPSPRAARRAPCSFGCRGSGVAQPGSGSAHGQGAFPSGRRIHGASSPALSRSAHRNRRRDVP